MNKNEKIIFIFILSILSLGLLFVTFNRYRFYHKFITITISTENREDSSITESSFTTDNIASINTEKSKININEAGLDALVSIPGIGRQTALKIINYRTQFGNYTSVEDLLKVKGIGYKKLENIYDYITVK